MSDNFDEFVRSHVEAASNEKLDLETEKAFWLTRLDELYALVSSSLRQYTDKGNIAVHIEDVDLCEEQLGTYRAKAARIVIGNNLVRLDPVGTFLVGARGRVDMTGPRGVARFMIVPPDSKGLRVIINAVRLDEVGDAPTVPAVPPPETWVWKIATPPPRITYIDLNEDSFRSTLMGVVNG
ncbi:hypothetical protein Bsp3421_003100 [Burkholderia sp. FERM BP-3421]|uniref:hypothetical protein n=1 Tax=Burkholderia sp. FERM BP-3421 TaxID=1494466 RepID=UPI002362F4C7|nr:hypothetical protein [Burkholderia sp. FERM BP-3421]WDD93054.1 hypothetical protein Bsp3421_003100 [Burkholderia sp. FERM BP-3421]